MTRRRKSRRQKAAAAVKGVALVKVGKEASKRAPIKPLAIAGAVGAAAAGVFAARRRGGTAQPA